MSYLVIKRALSLLLIGKSTECFFASWLRRLSFELKWFWPVERAMILPLRVTLRRLVNDLFVFILCSFDDDAQAFRTFFSRIGDFITNANEFQNSVHAFLEELFIHVLGSAR